ncbi:hypothetical protein HC031_12730 [Planosporangium thailandense]|uniref:FtsX extracellular domain-containing protein n=1 Tax=Planosporangium thailandense TaxID=765197 RepID=A0ABX0XZ99_9ACTN|nr:permease-like cell division protein FtsX [Planosporangium thailandense]NJC70572.1 hypothetical protein [Planosporangium thailandense]
MSARIREALDDLEHEVAALPLAPPHAIRARGRARRRRQAAVVATVAAGVAVTGAVALPSLTGRAGPAGVRSQQVVAAPVPSDSASTRATGGCVNPSASPTPSDADRAGALATSRKARVFLKPTATSTEKAAVDAALRGLKDVTAIEFLSHEHQWQRFAAQYCYAPDLVAATRPDSLPEAFDLTLASAGDYSDVEATIGRMAGVDSVVHAVP